MGTNTHREKGDTEEIIFVLKLFKYTKHWPHTWAKTLERGCYSIYILVFLAASDSVA